MLRTSLLFVGAALALGACAEPADRSTDWNYLHAAIIEPNCATAGCHSALVKSGGPYDYDIDLSSPTKACCSLAATQDLIDSGECGDEVGTWGLIEPPMTAEQTGLMMMLRGEPYEVRYEFGDREPEYDQMPIDVPLAPAEIALIQQWVEGGAPCE